MGVGVAVGRYDWGLRCCAGVMLNFGWVNLVDVPLKKQENKRLYIFQSTPVTIYTSVYFFMFGKGQKPNKKRCTKNGT